jgi:hypothetical protein
MHLNSSISKHILDGTEEATAHIIRCMKYATEIITRATRRNNPEDTILRNNYCWSNIWGGGAPRMHPVWRLVRLQLFEQYCLRGCNAYRSTEVHRRFRGLLTWRSRLKAQGSRLKSHLTVNCPVRAYSFTCHLRGEPAQIKDVCNVCAEGTRHTAQGWLRFTELCSVPESHSESNQSVDNMGITLPHSVSRRQELDLFLLEFPQEIRWSSILRDNVCTV